MDKEEYKEQENSQSTEETPATESTEDTPMENDVSEESKKVILEKNKNEVIKPHYDAFMYEPIGFQNYIQLRPADLFAEEEAKIKKQHMRHERTIIILFFVLILITLALSIYGIVYDVIKAEKTLVEIGKNQSIVIYQSSKPDGANDFSNFKDENGRYTTEGAAAYVRDSIVEIYTYSDAFHKKLLGTGSGVILNKEGYIVTNAHVLDANGFHDIYTSDENIYSAKIVGRDAKTDIAVLKINASNLSPAVLGDSDEVLVGEQVIAVGNPAGLSNTVTNGIVSAVNRKIKSDSTGFEMDCIQTNADISPGNSGGALVNMYGQVIGITSSKYASTLYEGLGFAITINEAKPIIEELINKGFIGGRFRIGITLIGMDSEAGIASIEDKLGFELPKGFKGVYIDSISEDCDIANTKLKAGDFITEIDDIPVSCYSELYEAISSSYGAGDEVPAKCVHVYENGKTSSYDIKFVLMEDTSGNY